ncbi:hypothetical protein [Ideonella livida]|uniref:hypothetical protein n=1 Tax=Ideonella livida TaxID=2707176 RepID=UPI00194023B9|nr:hypothetical protein [Ideonella livida]
MADPLPLLPDGRPLGPAHLRRLRELWRSAGWPHQDPLELDLLLAGLLEPQTDAAGRQTLRLTPAGLQALAGHHQRHRRARDGHEGLVARVAQEQQRQGRLVWRGLSLRAAVPQALLAPGAPAVAARDDTWDPPASIPGPDLLSLLQPEAPAGGPARPGASAAGLRWVMAMPDVYSIRPSSREDQVLPVALEIKVRRADLLSDLKRPAKGEAYRAMASECWYVLHAGIGQAHEVPDVFGVMVAHPDGQGGYGRLEVLRPAPRRPFQVPLAIWLALARATPEPAADALAQPGLAALDDLPGHGDADSLLDAAPAPPTSPDTAA